MTLPAGILESYAAIGNREDLSDVIYDISPVETPVCSTIPVVTATSRIHEWQMKTLTSAAVDNAALEGDDAADATSNLTRRYVNQAQILHKELAVSGTQEAIDSAGRASDVDLQVADKLLEMRTDLESSALNNFAAEPGDASTARRIGGLGAWLTINVNLGAGAGANPTGDGTFGDGTDARTDGTARAFLETQFKDVLQLGYTNGANCNMVSLGAFNKQVFSGFSGGQSRFGTAESMELVATIDVYRSDFGVLQIVPNRFQRARDAWVLDTDMLALAELRPAFSHDLAKSGDSVEKQMLHEVTLEVRNEKAHGLIADLTES